MLASRRWRDWNPPGNIEQGPGNELTKPPKPISVSFVSLNLGDSETIEAGGIPPHDPAEWREPFKRWVRSYCAYHPRCFGGIGCLHLAFCKWEITHNGVPCTRETFERMLEESGHLIADGLVSELILREDFAQANSEEIKNATRR